MPAIDVDKVQSERVTKLVRSWRSNEDVDYSKLFLSEKVFKSLNQNKMVLTGFMPDQVKAVLPFTPIIYAPICSKCVKKANYDEFKLFVQSGLLVPVLIGAYRFYDEHLREFILAHDHISYSELSAYRYVDAQVRGLQPMCGHCLMDRVEDVFKKIDSPDAQKHKEHFRRALSYLDPYPQSDSEIIELAFRSIMDRKFEQIGHFRKMAAVVDQIRVDEAFHSPVVLDEEDLAALPSNLSKEVDDAQSRTATLRKMIADGLSISIPSDLPIPAYIELVKDYQPRITQTIDGVLASGSSEASILNVSKNIMDINAEIERVRGLRRYTVLEASIGFFRNNKMLVGATLLAAAFGYAGSLAGCVATGGAAAGASWIKKMGLIKNNKASDRLREIVSRDLQPISNAFLSKYLGAKSPAINVISLQRRLETAKSKNATKKTS